MQPGLKDIVGLILFLAPGFLGAWIFHGLTAHAKPSPFERIIHALIFTLVVTILTNVTRVTLVTAGRWIQLGVWTEEAATIWSGLYGVLSGLLFAYCANNDLPHRLLRGEGRGGIAGGKFIWTKKTSHPSEWYAAFQAEPVVYITLHLTDGRRLYGWPYQWPNQSDSGHFIIADPHWCLEDGSRVAIPPVKWVLIGAARVEMVEFLKSEGEATYSDADSKTSSALIIENNRRKEESDDRKRTAAPAKSKTRQSRSGHANTESPRRRRKS